METEEKKWCVYIHRNKINNKVYIGTTQQNPKRRWQNGYGYKNNQHFWSAIQKYGWNNFEHIIWADELSQNDAAHMETLLIALYYTTNPEYGYNISIGGDFSHFGIKHSEDAKTKIRESQKKRFEDKENHPMYGKHHTEEARKRMSQKLKRFPCNNDNQSDITICQYSKQGLLIENFYSVGFASEKTGISKTAISNCLNRLSKTAGGYIWRYSYEELTEKDITLANSRNPKNQRQPNNLIQIDYWFAKKRNKYIVRLKRNGKYICSKAYKTKEEADMAIYNYKNNKESW